MDTEKKCNTCNQIKSLSSYQKNARAYDGLEHKCKECRKKTDMNEPRRGDRPVALDGHAINNEISAPDNANDANNIPNNVQPEQGRPPVAPAKPQPDTKKTADKFNDAHIDAIVQAAIERIILSIDLSDYPDMLSALQIHAYIEMRTPEMQAAFMLRQMLSEITTIEDHMREW